MSISKITEILGFPHGTPIEAVQGTVVAVYDRREIPTKYGPNTVQTAVLKDVAGNQIRFTVWGHPDLSPMKDKEVVIHSPKPGAVKVKHDTYTPKEGKPGAGIPKRTVELEVSKAGQFQFVEVYHQQSGQTAGSPAAANPSPSGTIQDQSHGDVAGPAQKAVKAIFGATAGLGVNNARLECEAAGVEPTEDELWKRASKYVRVSLKIERGELHLPDKAPNEIPF